MNQTLTMKLVGLFLLMLADCVNATMDSHDVYKNDHTGDYEAHEAEEHKVIEARMASLKDAAIYSCQLLAFGNQCREYPILDSEQSELESLRVSCESLPGARLMHSNCPTPNRVGACKNIVRNNHDPKTLIYTNIYYRGEGSLWTDQEISRVCADMDGKVVLNDAN